MPYRDEDQADGYLPGAESAPGHRELSVCVSYNY